jgi:hypothetical protein
VEALSTKRRKRLFGPFFTLNRPLQLYDLIGFKPVYLDKIPPMVRASERCASRSAIAVATGICTRFLMPISQGPSRCMRVCYPLMMWKRKGEPGGLRER